MGNWTYVKVLTCWKCFQACDTTLPLELLELEESSCIILLDSAARYRTTTKIDSAHTPEQITKSLLPIEVLQDFS